MKKCDTKALADRKANIDERLSQKDKRDMGAVFSGANDHYEVSSRVTATSCGGIAMIHRMVRKLGLAEEINKSLNVLKLHVPYHESDHVLNLAYNVVCGGKTIEDLENLRQDEAYMNAIGARRIPDPTTAGDFLRRFTKSDIDALSEALNRTRLRVWKMQPREFFDMATIDIDGTTAPTLGEKKEGCDFNYKGEFGYAPLFVTMANTNEVIYVHNRSGNRPSNEDAFEFLQPATEWMRDAGFRRILLRGDTDFSMTEHLDYWSEQKVNFVFGFDAKSNLVKLAKNVEDEAWSELNRTEKVSTNAPRAKRSNVKDQVVRDREYKNLELEDEHYTEIEYQPKKCGRSYRMIICRKTIRITKGELMLFPYSRYFFFITNVDCKEMSAPEIIFQSNKRCNQENIIEQMKNGVGAMNLPSHTMDSNGAYMLIASLAWNLKAWLSLVDSAEPLAAEIGRMEFRRFVDALIRIPCQVVRTGRKLILRILAYARWARYVGECHDRLRDATVT